MYPSLFPSQFHLELLTDRQDDSNVHGIVDGQNLSFGRVTSESPEPLICYIISYLLSLIISYYLLSPSQFHLELSTDRQDDSNVHGIVDGQNLLYIQYVRYFSYVEFFLTHGLLSTICTYQALLPAARVLGHMGRLSLGGM